MVLKGTVPLAASIRVSAELLGGPEAELLAQHGDKVLDLVE